MFRIITCSLFVFFITLQVSGQWTLPYPKPAIQKQQQENKKVKSVRRLDSAQIVNDLRFLSSDSCQGRKPGTIGHQRAMQRIATRFRQAKLDSFGISIFHPFTAIGRSPGNGVNIAGWIKGRKHPDKFMVLTAHYDHMGKNGDATYFGADDNASGVACLLGLAKYFRKNPLPYSLIFVALDREESGLQGAFHFVEWMEEQDMLSNIILNVNMDMIARSDSNEVYVAGVKHYPQLLPVIKAVVPKTRAVLLMGHDYGSSRSDWTRLSDQYAFHRKHIPFLFISVEDHADYHKPTDTFERINLSRFIENCNLVAQLAKAVQ